MYDCGVMRLPFWPRLLTMIFLEQQHTYVNDDSRKTPFCDKELSVPLQLHSTNKRHYSLNDNPCLSDKWQEQNDEEQEVILSLLFIVSGPQSLLRPSFLLGVLSGSQTDRLFKIKVNKKGNLGVHGSLFCVSWALAFVANSVCLFVYLFSKFIIYKFFWRCFVLSDSQWGKPCSPQETEVKSWKSLNSYWTGVLLKQKASKFSCSNVKRFNHTLQ